MKILILYATTEGLTRKIAAYVADLLAADEVTLLDAAEAPADLDPLHFDAAILAASVHAHRYQSSLVTFARTRHEALNRIPALFISVSLSAAGDDPHDLQGLVECSEKFQAETGWTRGRVVQVAGAFRFTQYDFFKSWMMRRIAKEKGVKIDPHEDLEFTDWAALKREVETFRSSLG